MSEPLDIDAIAARNKAEGEFAKAAFDDFVPELIRGGMTYSFRMGWFAAHEKYAAEIKRQAGLLEQVRGLREDLFRHLENPDHMVHLEQVIDALDAALNDDKEQGK